MPNKKGLCVSDLKEYLCRGKDLLCDELQIIRDGRVSHDNDELTPQCFALVKNSVARCVNVSIRVTGDKTKRSIELSLPLNMRVSNIKSLLLKKKHTKWSVRGQRLIAASKVMKDHHILGDYLIHSSCGKKGISPLTIHLSQTIDSKAEMEIFVTLPNKREIKFYFEFGVPLYYAKDILQKMCGFPKDADYFFLLEDGTSLADMNKCLLDYGILPSTCKSLHTKLAMNSKPSPLMFAGISHGDNGKVVFCPIGISAPATAVNPNVLPMKPKLNRDSSSSPLLSSNLPSAANLKKKPDNKRKSPTCTMFGGMKKGFLSNSNGKRKKHD